MAFNPNMKISQILDNAPFYIDKHLTYFKDKYSKFFKIEQ